jgi:hypothetical protein
MKRLFALVLALSLSGCSTSAPLPPPQPVSIIASDYCAIQPKPRSWDVADTPETIDQIRRDNAKWESRCRKRRK